jgi:cyanate permease
MDSLLYGLLWWMAMSAVTALMWLPVFLYQRARDKKRQQRK